MGAGDALRVLIADADSALRQELFSALLAADIFSDCVASVREAISYLDHVERPYAVVVLDVALPGGDVEQVISRIAALPQRPVVLVLGSPDAARTLDVEIVQIVIRRPVRLTQIVDFIRSCIRNAGARAQPSKPEGDHLIS